MHRRAITHEEFMTEAHFTVCDSKRWEMLFICQQYGCVSENVLKTSVRAFLLERFTSQGHLTQHAGMPICLELLMIPSHFN